MQNQIKIFFRYLSYIFISFCLTNCNQKGIENSNAYSLKYIQLIEGDIPLFDENEIIDFTEYKNVMIFIDDFMDSFIPGKNDNHPLERKDLLILFSKVKFQRKAYQLIYPKLNNWQTIKNLSSWCRYRKNHVTRGKIKKGLNFWLKNKKAILENIDNVDPFILLSTLGIETIYGSYTGNFPILSTLMTLSFTKGRRKDFFSSELKSFLTLLYKQRTFFVNYVREWHKFPKGSYASAMGLPQFLASNYLKLAKDADGDGAIDLWKSISDIAKSMSYYYEHHGWRFNEPIGMKIKVPPHKKEDLNKIIEENGRFEPWITISQLRTLGIYLPEALDPNEKVSLFLFQCPENFENNFYFIGFFNFYVITRYNHSSFYAMAVYELSQKLFEEIKLQSLIP